MTADEYLGQRGSKNKMSKLTDKDVLEIKDLLKTQKTTWIAKEYGVDPTTISQIKYGRTWDWLGNTWAWEQ